MPDIDFQKIELNLIPKKGDEPVIFYASQYESARPFIADLMWGTTEFAPGDDCYVEIDIRKNDNNLVVITDDVAIDNNEVSVILPVQALTCIGKNLGQVKIYAADDQLIAALNFLLEVQPDPLAGGVDSETAIDNLTTQIESIAEEVIGENYYDKTEVDALLADKADVSDLPDMTQYYTKTQTDTLLNGKADASTTYTKTEVDNALALKANSSDLATVATTGDYDDLINKPSIPAAQIQSDYAQADNTQVDYIKNKPDIAGMIADALLAVMPVETVGPASVANFNTDIATNLVSVKCTIEAVQSGSGTPSPSNPRPISGYSACNVGHCGVNLFLFSDDTKYNSQNCTIAYENGGVTITATSNYARSGYYIPTVVGRSYTISFDGTSTGNLNKIYVSDELVWNSHYGDINLTSTETHYTKTITAISNILFIGCYVTSNDSSGVMTIKNFQVELGSTPSAYQPYAGGTETINLGSTVYGGVYDANRGKLTVTWAEYSGSWNFFRQNNGYKAYQSNVEVRTSRSEGLCNIINEFGSFSSMNMDRNIIEFSGNNYAYVALDENVDISELQLIYPLATPIEYDLTPVQIAAILGDNNVFADTGDTEVKYKVSIQKYVDDQ